MDNKRKSAFILLQFLVIFCVYSQQDKKPAVESFEAKNVLKKYDKTATSHLSISTDHQRFGKSSLEWEWSGKENSFGTSNFMILSKEESPLAYGDHFPASPTFIFSLYNEQPQEGKIRISFEKDGKDEVWFHLALDFKGWRRLWVPFYEMNGNRPEKGAAVDFDYFKISSDSQMGKLFFDDIIFSQYQDDRHQYPDLQVPFIKKGQEADKDHWMPQLSFLKRLRDLKGDPISVAARADLARVEKNLDASLTIANKYQVYMDDLKKRFSKLGIKADEKALTGPPLTYRLSQEYYSEKQQGPKIDNTIRDLGKVLKKLADYYDRADSGQKQEIERMFVAGSKYFLDQGWQVGASGGTRHHIGYQLREITEAFYIMRKLLRKAGLLNDIGASLQWLYNLGMVLGDEKEFHVNMDYLNTQSYYQLMVIFLMKSQEKQAALLQAYSKYLTIILAQQGEEWGFKIDGTSWHHNGHYPAYGMGAFEEASKVFHSLAGTQYRIGEAGHQNFKHAFLTSRAYSQLYDWGFGNAGRHPFEGTTIKPLRESYLRMAFSGNPEGTSKIDKDVASAYLRLWGKEDLLNSAIFNNAGIHKEVLAGYRVLPYAATAIHRQNNWAAIIKGYSKYVWASEIYVDENRYGRYPANGTVELLSTKGEKGSGMRQEGWDWNRFPGATVIYLSYEELEPEMPLLMFRSDETFAGAVQLDGNGAFGMVLNESKGSNADGPESKVGFLGKLKAKKSVFSFGDKLICIGTNISSIDEKNPTQTNLFQIFLTEPKMPMYSASGTIEKFPYKTVIAQDLKSKAWLTDPYGNGYYILSDTPIHVKKEHQHSYKNNYSLRTGQVNPKGKGEKETEGDYATAWIDHGTAPADASYQYVVYPFIQGAVEKFGQRAKNDTSYNILRADGTAHIVLDKKTETTVYVVFEANKDLENEILKEVSAPAMVMVRQDDNDHITLSAVQPDLNFPEYEPGKYRNYSTLVSLTLTLKGIWKTPVNNTVKTVTYSGDTTLVTLECKNGFSEVFRMDKS